MLHLYKSGVFMIWANGKLYTFYDHFIERAEERGIKTEWVEEAMNDPDDVNYSQSTDRYLYDKYIDNAKRDNSCGR